MQFVNAKKKLKIFISSVFFEPNKEWPLRKLLSEQLLNANHETWLWEVNGEKEYEQTKTCWYEIVSRAICRSDIIITFYKTRAGDSSWFLPEIPFYPTDYEMAEAIKYNIPLRIYFIRSKSISEELKGVKKIYSNKEIIGGELIYCSSEKDFIDKVLLDVNIISTSGFNLGDILLLNSPFMQSKSSDWLENQIYLLTSATKFGDYESAYSIISADLDIKTFTPRIRGDKILLARCLGVYANIYANRSMYEHAINCVYKSIRLFMEVGAWNDLFGQIQALSGIQNMKGLRSAQYINNYGFRSIRNYLISRTIITRPCPERAYRVL